MLSKSIHTVIAKARLSPNVTRLDVVAPRIAQIRQPGQFVIVHLAEGAERIPLTIADADKAKGTIALVIQAVGKSTRELVALEPGEVISGHRRPAGQADRNDCDGQSFVHRGRRGHGGGSSDRPGPAPARGAGHQHYRRPFEGMGDF